MNIKSENINLVCTERSDDVAKYIDMEKLLDLLPTPKDESEAEYRGLVTELIYDLDTITIDDDE